MQATTTKIGRNDPCHCGSGLKYKKCHAAKDEAARAAESAAQAAAAVAAAAAAAAEADEDGTAKPTAPSGTKDVAKRTQAAKALPKPPKGPPPGRAARRKHAV